MASEIPYHFSHLQYTRGDLPQSDLFEQYTQVLRTLARQGPLLLVLDDLQWADVGTINLLFHLGRRLEGCPILTVGQGFLIKN